VGLRITEVPSMEEARVYGASNLHTFRDGFRVLRQILRTSPLRACVRAPGLGGGADGRPEAVAILVETEAAVDDRTLAGAG
jgi:hypothetical protein